MTTPESPKPPSLLLEIDRMVHEPARLAILAALYPADTVEFLFLQKVTTLSKGNLSSHAQKLEDAGYVRSIKTFRSRIPVTSFRITAAGRKALEDYEATMRAFTQRNGPGESKGPP
jgi:DNA-binding MarR family transcriptional regulator